MEVHHIFLTSLWCVGVWNAFNKGMIFENADIFLAANLKDFIYKPLLGCVRCMASIHGLAAYLVFYQTIDLMVIPFIVCVSGLNVLLSNYLD